MKCPKRSNEPLHRILLSEGYERVLRLLGEDARRQIEADMNADHENRIDDILGDRVQS